jgi:hypothetical protein
MIDVIWNMLDQGPSHISENALQVRLIIAAGDRVIIEYLLDAPVQENILHALRGNQVFDEAPGFGGVKVTPVHRNQSIQGLVALGVQPDVNVPSILVRAVMGGGSSTPAGKICEEKIARIRELCPDSLYRVEQSANHFRSGIGPALITQMVTRKLIWKYDTIFQMSLVRAAIRGGKRLTCLD